MKTDLLDLRLGDCMDLMRDTPDGFFDLAIVDPPYGIRRAGQPETHTKNPKHKRKRHATKEWDDGIPGSEYFAELLRVSKHQIIWGANYFVEHLIHGSMGWIVWDKGQHGLSMSDCELAYSSFDRATRVKIINRVELLTEGTIHPTQKPIALYKWLLANYAKPGQRILDTHLGSGSIAIACHYFGAHLTATEIDPDYYAAACERIQRETQQIELFRPASQHPAHEEIPLL
jgi:site-specific DNA-methyltransferase (adenine-specific)